MLPKPVSDVSLPDQIDSLCDAFEALWRAGQAPRIEEQLAKVPMAGRSALLRELLTVEIEYRLTCGQSPNLAEYFTRFPELSAEPQLQRDLEKLLNREANSTISAKSQPSKNDTAIAEPFTGYFAKSANDNIAATLIEDASTARSIGSTGLTVGAQFGRYHLLKILGEGGMGRVYLAHDQQLNRQVALKTPRDSSGVPHERFLREGRAAAILRHPNICPIFDVGEIDGACYLTMAFIAGEPLTRYTKLDSLLPQRQVAVLLQKLALAVHEAHELGVVHRDLKPDNIMLDQRGEPIVMDFGLARREQAGEETLTHEGAIMGTPAYMSPEQVEGDTKAIGPRSDIYSLGVMLFELLAGQRPFQGTATSLMAKILRDPPPSLASLRHDVEPKLEWVCWKAMEKNQSQRYRDCREMADALQQFLESTASARSPLTIRAQAKVIEAPTEPIETYQLTPKPVSESEDIPDTTDQLAATKIKDRIRHLVDDADFAKTLLKFVGLEPSQRSPQKLSRLVSQGREAIQRLVDGNQYPQALRFAAAMHLACAASESLTELSNCTQTAATARWNPEDPASAVTIWQKMITAFPNESSLRQQAIMFANQHAEALCHEKKPMAALELYRQARTWTDSSIARRNLVSLLKRLASSAIRARQFDRARKLCEEALEIYPKDEPLQALHQQALQK